MQEFVIRSNIARYKKLIGETTEADQLAALRRLLDVEEARLASLAAKR